MGFHRSISFPCCNGCHDACSSSFQPQVLLPNTVLLSLASNCQQLRSLDMCRSIELTEVELKHLASHCKNIEDLDLGWCRNVRADIGEMLRELPRLRRLVLTANRSVSDTDLESLANHCPLLEQLDIPGTVIEEMMELMWMDPRGSQRLFDVEGKYILQVEMNTALGRVCTSSRLNRLRFVVH
uniref:Uncharacterized protein n=1 Tax=Eptatretus burgeri TaxID=7764 RepID=A0A8C4WVH6_EPTBU